MRGAPNFVEWPDAVDGIWKIQLLRWLGREAGIDTLVETGTCEGVTPFNLKDDFKAIYTMELHDGLFSGAKRWLEPYPHIHCYRGSSRNLLESMLEEDVPAGPILFWLDAHSSGPHTADDGDPLPDELRVITRLRPDALVVIDDMMGLNQFMGQVSGTMRDNCGDTLFTLEGDAWHVEYRTGEIILHMEGRYHIPPFEA